MLELVQGYAYWIGVGVLVLTLILANHFGGTKLVLIFGITILFVGTKFFPALFAFKLFNLGIITITCFTVILGIIFSFFVASFTRKSEEMDDTVGSFWSRMILMLLAFVTGVVITALIPYSWESIITLSPSNSTSVFGS